MIMIMIWASDKIAGPPKTNTVAAARADSHNPGPCARPILPTGPRAPSMEDEDTWMKEVVRAEWAGHNFSDTINQVTINE